MVNSSAAVEYESKCLIFELGYGAENGTTQHDILIDDTLGLLSLEAGP